MKNIIKDIIHDIAINETGIYSSLYFCSNKKIQDFTFNFTFLKYNKKHFFTSENDSIKQDIYFLLDNIISKTLELNFNIDYTKTKRLGGNILYNNDLRYNPYIINDYIFTDPLLKISDLENYLDDIEISDENTGYRIKWKIPIYSIESEKIKTSSI